MVSSVVSNSSERLVTHRVDDDLVLSEESSSLSRKSRSKFFRSAIATLLVLSFLAGVTVLSYYLISKYKSLNEFKSNLNEHLSTDFPNLEKPKREASFNELTNLYKDGLISKDVKLEYEVYREFEEFNAKYNKVHKDDKQRRSKLVVFRKSYLEVKNQKGDEPYTKGINWFSDLSEKEFYALFRPIKSPSAPRLPPSDHVLHLLGNPTYLKNLKLAKNTTQDVDPTKVTGEDLDWRRAKTVSKVRDQKNCGGCWAFSTVSAVESFYLTYQQKSYELSVQQLLNCENYSYGCDGGFPLSAFNYVKKYGLVPEKSLPFVEKDEKCSVPSADRVFIPRYYVFKGEDTYKKSLVMGPTVVYMAASPELSRYKSGVFTGSCAQVTNHAVLLVGEGFDEKTNKRYWVVKNSWGNDWGEEGYFKLERTFQGNDKCEVLDTGICPSEV